MPSSRSRRLNPEIAHHPQPLVRSCQRQLNGNTHIVAYAGGRCAGAAAKAVDYHNIRIDGNTVTLADPDAQLDLGFLAKGAIGDRLKAFFLQKNITSALINLGGNVLAVGQKPDGTAFRTGIKKPFSETNELVDIVALKDQSLVSSGNYERCFWENGVLYHHILDPRTGYPVDTD